MRLAGAPISWGVCEVPGWGEQLAPERVLAEIAQLGLPATELGPQGWMPDPGAALAAHGLALVGGFVPLAPDTPLDVARAAAAELAGLGADVFVAALVADLDWGPRTGPVDWPRVGAYLREVADVAAEAGVTAVLHPHAGTLVETDADVQAALAHTDVPWCLDTGHLLIGGTDPVAFARDHRDRIGHVHVKDVDARIAARVRAGELSLLKGTRAGLFRPLGDGDVDLRGVLGALAGYDGWIVLEQDLTLDPGEAHDPAAGVRRSLDWLQGALT